MIIDSSSNGISKATALVLLDLSATFDIIDPEVLLYRLPTDMVSQGLLYYSSCLISLYVPRLFPVQSILHRLVLSLVASHKIDSEASSFLHLHTVS